MASSLICITSCNRIEEIKKYIFPIIDFCNHHDDFDFLLSLDGNSEEYQNFCNTFDIPLLYSDKREGVGLSKNRVLKKFPNYKYYFFIEDDVELLNPDVFNKHIMFSKACKIPHLTYCVFGPSAIDTTKNGWNYKQGFQSGAQFSFFEGKQLFKVGGWNTIFAKYKRFGHTEHSYRFRKNALQEYPFVALNSTYNDLILHDPPHVTSIDDSQKFDYHPEEKALINSDIKYTAVETISSFHFNDCNMNFNKTVERFLKGNKRRYPLTKGRRRLIAFAEFHFGLFEREKRKSKKFKHLIISFFYYPFSSPMKHLVKSKFFR